MYDILMFFQYGSLHWYNIVMYQQQESSALDSFFYNTKLKAYIFEQIKQAKLPLEKVLKRQIILSHTIQPSSKAQEKLRFMIVLGKGFPMTAPQVFIASSFPQQLSIRGYRDFLEEILGVNWSIKYRLSQITERLTQFLKRIRGTNNSFLFLQTIGTYHYPRLYSYHILKELSQSGPYVCFETGQQSVTLYVADLTSTHFVLFKPTVQPYFKQTKLIVPKEQQIQDLKLDFVAELQGLLQIGHCRADKHEYLLKFDGEDVMHRSVSVWQKKLKITKSTQMIQAIIRRFKHLRGAISLQSAYAEEETEEDQILQQVKKDEETIRSKFNRKSIDALNKSYQKLVQFYSSMGLPYQEVYLRKIANLFSRQDVRLIMQEGTPIL